MLRTEKRFIENLAPAVLLVCFTVFTLGTAFNLSHFKHEHNRHGAGGVCTECARIQALQNLSQTHFPNAVPTLLANPVWQIILAGHKLISQDLPNATPVSRKIRLNN
ncbi:MAG: hypothetical protein LBD99_07310 [Candidatus Margulisbacteria bacterium]|jgi:hypothetical protein|nr:hypothetical protein [Candidatus Margulisiibacteriota bacterium]